MDRRGRVGRALPLLGVLIAAVLGSQWLEPERLAPAPRPAASAAPAAADRVLGQAFSQGRSGEQVRGAGVVVTLLPDDREGSRHQRFILRLQSGQTLLVAHNIDLAPRIPALAAGDTVAFNGVYEWNRQGGVIHWTHHDPAGRHEPGWLQHEGRFYR